VTCERHGGLMTSDTPESARTTGHAATPAVLSRATALSEIDFTRLVVRAFGLPEPTRQRVRYDSHGRRRWLDVLWEGARIIVEIDGSHHMDAIQWWDDMDRENDMKLDGYLVLRFTAFIVRHRPDYVAAQIRDAFRKSGHALTA
jgi:Protein of unknown function (DUF559)